MLASLHQHVCLCHSCRLWPPLSSRLPLRSRNLSISQGPAIRGLDCSKLIHNHTALRAFYPAASSSPLKRPAVGVFTCCLLKGFLCSCLSLLFPLFLCVSLPLISFITLPNFFLSFCPSPFCMHVMPVGVSQHNHWIPFLGSHCLFLCHAHTPKHTHTSDHHISAFDCSLQLHKHHRGRQRGERIQRWVDDRMKV